jgi:hypothetical protein
MAADQDGTFADYSHSAKAGDWLKLLVAANRGGTFTDTGGSPGYGICHAAADFAGQGF